MENLSLSPVPKYLNTKNDFTDSVIILESRAAHSMNEFKRKDGRYIWKIKNYDGKFWRARKDPHWFLKREFPSADGLHTMQARVFLNGTGSATGRHMSVFLRVMDEPAEVLHYRMTIRLLDQSRGSGRDVCWIDEPLLGSTMATDWMDGDWGRQEFVSHELMVGTNAEKYIVNDTAILEFRVHPVPRIARFCASDNGILEWHVSDYARRKRCEMDGITWCVHSEPFYSAPGGRRLKAQLFLNGYGDGRGSHLTVCLGVLEGINDRNLSRQFDRRVSFTLKDRRVGPDSSVVTPSQDWTRFYVVDSAKMGNEMAARINATYWGVHKFVPHALVEKEDSSYLIFDSIVIVIKVDTLE